MLDTPVEKFQFNEEGAFEGVHAGGQFAKAKFVLGDPTYFPDRVKTVGKVARCICIMDKPVESTKTQSCQIIIPHTQCKTPRSHDIYILQLSEVHKVCPKGMYLAIVSTFAETDDPQKELEPGLAMLRKNVIETFYSVSPLYEVCRWNLKTRISRKNVYFNQCSRWRETRWLNVHASLGNSVAKYRGETANKKQGTRGDRTPDLSLTGRAL